MKKTGRKRARKVAARPTPDAKAAAPRPEAVGSPNGVAHGAKGAAGAADAVGAAGADSALWRALAAFDVDCASAAGGPADGAAPKSRFADKLAREQGWTRAFADRAIEEYKRFLFLAATSGALTVPSEAVDQVWHLHLTHTRSYWDDLCAKTLGRPLHHDPSPGGWTARDRHARAYARTLERYRRVFGAAPDCTIWPAVEQRFPGCAPWLGQKAAGSPPRAADADGAAFDAAAPSTAWRRWRRRLWLAAAILLGLGVWGAVAGPDARALGLPELRDWIGPMFVGLGALGGLLTLVLGALSQEHDGRSLLRFVIADAIGDALGGIGGGDGCGGGCGGCGGG